MMGLLLIILAVNAGAFAACGRVARDCAATSAGDCPGDRWFYRRLAAGFHLLALGAFAVLAVIIF